MRKGQGCEISPLFHEDDQDDQTINLILGWGELGFCGQRARYARSFPERRSCRMVCRIKVHEKRDKRDKSLFHVPDHARRAPNILQVAAVSVFHLVSRVTNGTISLPTRYELANVPFVTQRPASGLGWPQAGVRWCGVFQVVKTAQSRERTGRTLLTALSQLPWRDK
jgi:hypothetical protein